jgi:threonine/homoserine/homoserine lactone efflux protein
VNQLLGLVVFAFAGSVSPGPNNTILWASGLQFGFRRSVPHVVGTSFGIGALVLAVAAGIGALLEAVPAVETGLKLAGSGYLLYLAYRVLGAGVFGRGQLTKPLTLWQAITFQCLNPKAWLFAVAAVGAFLPAERAHPGGVALLTLVLMAVVVCSSGLWAAGGVVIGQVVETERLRRGIQIALAGLLVASVALIWI